MQKCTGPRRQYNHHRQGTGKSAGSKIAPLTPLGHTSIMTMTSPVMVQINRVSIKVPSIAIMPCSTGWLGARCRVRNRGASQPGLVRKKCPGQRQSAEPPRQSHRQTRLSPQWASRALLIMVCSALGHFANVQRRSPSPPSARKRQP